MKRYKITFNRKKKSELVDAYGFTMKGDKYYFHMKPDMSDFSSFKSGVSSVTEVPPFKGEYDQIKRG